MWENIDDISYYDPTEGGMHKPSQGIYIVVQCLYHAFIYNNMAKAKDWIEENKPF